MADPSRLIAATEAVNGKTLRQSRYGDPVAVPPGRIIQAADGMALDLAGRTLTVLDTPGHAKDHVSLIDEKTGHVFAGDTFGFSISGALGVAAGAGGKLRKLPGAPNSILRERIKRFYFGFVSKACLIERIIDRILVLSIAAALMALARPFPVHAFEIDAGSEWKLRWDNTVKYSSAWRVRGRDRGLLAVPNRDDGNRNFAPGLISNRLDLLSELDVVHGEKGLHLSGAAWYDTVYNQANDNDAPATANPFSVPNDRFPEATRRLHGREAEILNAFAFANGKVAGVPASIRAGKHTLLWGESLLLATNGISYAQAPLDFIKALSVPGTQAKELFMPVGQVSGQLRPTPAFSLAAYYQYDWRRTRLPAAGSYFSSADMLDDGGERLFAGPTGAAFFRGPDRPARDGGQYGISARYRPESSNTEFGLYWLQFHDKLPQLYLQPGVGVDPARGQIGEYSLVYPENIRLIGASFASSAGAVSLAGEIHLRRNTPLASLPPVILPGQPADNRHHALYAVGESVHAQLSALYTLASTPLWNSADLAAEVGWQRRTRVTRNPEALDPSRDRQAWAFLVLFTPNYYQVRDNLDLSLPISLSYSPKGKAPLPVFDAPHQGGTLSVGVTAEYRKQWTFGLRLTHFLGEAAFQPLKDRDFASFDLRHTF